MGRLLLRSLLPAFLGAGMAWTQVSGTRLEQLLFHSPAGDTVFQVRLQDGEGGQVVRSHYDGQGFLLFRGIFSAGLGAYLDAAGDTLYRSRQTSIGDSTRLELADALGRTLIGAAYGTSAGPAGYTVRPDSLVGQTELKYVTTAEGRTDSIYVRQGGGLTHIVKVRYRGDVKIGSLPAGSLVQGFSYAHPGRVRIRFAPSLSARKISARLHRMDGSRVTRLAAILPPGHPEYVLDVGNFSGFFPAGVYAVRLYLGSEELFRFRLTRP